MVLRFPAPLRPGEIVGVSATSSPVPDNLRPRLQAAIAAVQDRGYRVVLGDCLDIRESVPAHISAPAHERAAELMAMLTDPTIRAVIPPWGGETAIDVLALLDWPAIAAAEPTWMVGYSDIATVITPLTLRTALATVHGNNLMDTPYRPADGLLSWLDIATLPAGATFSQSSPGRFRRDAHVDYSTDPGANELILDAEGGWKRLDVDADVNVQGRLIGGCIETISPVAGSSLGDVPRFVREHAPEGTLVYLEAAESSAFTICRALHGMRLAGFFTQANAVLIGRTAAPDADTLTQREAVMDALGSLDVPIIADVECGHIAPFMPLVNGAHARLRLTGEVAELTQSLW
ncbi:MAG: S66 peptidase family protein [Ornithinimicrobium sp.]